MTGIARGNNFNNPVRGAGTAFVCKLVFVTYDTYIRFNNGFPVIMQFNGKWGRIDFTGVVLRLDIIVYSGMKPA